MSAATVTERPRKTSAARRRRNIKKLPWLVHTIAPGADTVLLTPVATDVHGPAERRYVVTARSAGCKQHLRLPRGGCRRLTELMQAAFPSADWNRAQTWRADTNQLTGWQQRQAAS
jgi:hypothetical protein